MSKYSPLQHNLQARPPSDTTLTFDEIEKILGFKLPPSAHEHNAWWSNERGSHVQARAWMDAGWKVWHVQKSNKKVHFKPIPEEPQPPPADASLRGGVEDAGAPFARDDAIVVSRAALRGGAIRLLEDFSEAHGGGLADAIVGILNGLVVERRRQLLERFPKTGAPSPVDSAELIRQDRDAR